MRIYGPMNPSSYPAEDYKDSDGSASDASDCGTLKNLPCSECPECPGITFPNASKLKYVRLFARATTNKGNSRHLNSHAKPYRCVTGDCSQAFSQQQALDRHVLAKHGDTNKPTKFYHCTVDGCKYSSTGWKRRKFTREDHVKEHIKDKGHYGPHSPSDRPRRPGEPLVVETVILARFEIWEVDISSNSQPRRIVQYCEFNSCKTKLWHLDITAEALLRDRDNYLVTEWNHTVERTCSFWNCYFTSRPPENCELVLFKTDEALQEHRRRAHDEAPVLDFSLISQSQEPAPQNSSIRHFSSTELTSSLWGSELPSSVDLASPNMGTESSVSGPANPGSALLPGSQDFATFLSPYPQFSLDTPCLSGVPGTCCYCQSCQRHAVQEQFLSHQELPTTWAWADPLPPELQYPPFLDATMPGGFNILPIAHAPSSDTHHSISTSESKTSSLVSEDSQKLREGRFACYFPSCRTTVRRKGDLTRHLDSVHSPRTHSCKICKRQYNRKDKLTEHRRAAHPTVYPYPTKRGYNSTYLPDCVYLPTVEQTLVERPAKTCVAPSEMATLRSQPESWGTADADSSRDNLFGMPFEEHLLDGLGTCFQLIPAPEIDMDMGKKQSPINLD
ncbi:hypothetical protein DL98DRAFT_300185 [Cadophora sp. DSE1049]|nr:hypothetical protein DL98DRAFT_300185 [Cadophora sp. DSE1049]